MVSTPASSDRQRSLEERTGIVRCLEPGGFDLATAKKARTRKRSLEQGNRLRCRRCGHTVTDVSQRMAMNGTHAHRFRNPAGCVYDIGCYRAAPGCDHVGEALSEHTWFAGYRWQIAVCARCGEHLGWRFRDGAGDEFHGLIIERLVAEQ